MVPRTLTIVVAVVFHGMCFSAWAQNAGSNNPYLMRMERQTRDENVCMLVQQDGHYHLERIITGRTRVFEGMLDNTVTHELDPLLNSPELVGLRQNQIEASLVGEDMDALIVAIRRQNGWQSLTFPSGKSRKPYKSAMDPLIKWLDRNKQQQNPIVGASTTRCIPPQSSATDTANKVNSTNRYAMRLVVDHYEPVQSSTQLHYADFKVTRECTIVYQNGRYRREKSVQQFNTTARSEVYQDTLDKDQLRELRTLLENPRLVSMPSRAAQNALAREGEVVSIAIPREDGVQQLSFSSFFGARTKEQGMRDNLGVVVDTGVELTHPLQKWVKQNVEDHKTTKLEGVPSTGCIPTAQPE